MQQSAYLLVSHGSRDPRPQQAMMHLAELVAQQVSLRALQPLLATGGVFSQAAALVETAALELAPLPLHQQIQHFAQRVFAAGYHPIKILPLFLLPGVHVMEDIPAEVAIAQQNLAAVTLEVCPYLGSHTKLQDLLNPVSEETPAPDRIVLSHGSQRTGGNQPVEAIAAQLNALPAYWSVPSSLETQISRWAQQGSQNIVILPYFLFEGAITDAIAQAVQRLQQQFPDVRLHLAQPLGATADLATLIADLAD